MRSSVIIFAITGCVGTSEPTVEQTTQAASGQTLQHFTINGASVDIASNPPGDTLSVMENQTASSRVVQLMYALTTPDPTSQICYTYYGYTYCTYYRFFYDSGLGTISADDFQSGPESARLHTTLTGSTTIGVMRCVADYLNYTFDCEPQVPSGDIDLVWVHEPGAPYLAQSGTTEQSFGSNINRTSGSYRTSIAHGSGTILGKPIDGLGGLNDTHQSVVSRDIIAGH